MDYKYSIYSMLLLASLSACTGLKKELPKEPWWQQRQIYPELSCSPWDWGGQGAGIRSLQRTSQVDVSLDLFKRNGQIDHFILNHQQLSSYVHVVPIATGAKFSKIFRLKGSRFVYLDRSQEKQDYIRVSEDGQDMASFLLPTDTANHHIMGGKSEEFYVIFETGSSTNIYHFHSNSLNPLQLIKREQVLGEAQVSFQNDSSFLQLMTVQIGETSSSTAWRRYQDKFSSKNIRQEQPDSISMTQVGSILRWRAFFGKGEKEVLVAQLNEEIDATRYLDIWRFSTHSQAHRVWRSEVTTDLGDLYWSGDQQFPFLLYLEHGGLLDHSLVSLDPKNQQRSVFQIPESIVEPSLAFSFMNDHVNYVLLKDLTGVRQNYWICKIDRPT